MTADRVVIRLRHDADLPALAASLVRVHSVDGYPVEGVADPEAWLQHPHALRSWTAEIAGKPIGQVTLTSAEPDDEAAQVWRRETGGALADLVVPVRLFVDPDHRGAGAAQLLMSAAMEYARSLHRAVALDVMAKDRAAIRLYERLGARRLDTISHNHSDGLSEPAIVYDFPA
ncbi:GNAT family N-acetyltransferase [Pseudonocardia sp. 73-21]|uniref:GNAT family N-acetyltransferase n=1 Tax=Pseudonocardia sp. 73-21 TaxID=1895809 RepID=UPI000967D302|nr:GNAT family N-acetyltransferase [Pseudonocardia sp. 73-21]OJY49531.1 MAG: hypothetical protein BGP03_13560 [Pseudonocardia sp. 73-21]